jgi:PAS domain S-box-containing protein
MTVPGNPEAERLSAEIASLERRLEDSERARRELALYIRRKTDHMLEIMRCSAGNADALDDETLLSLDPIGTVSDTFEQVVANLHATNERLLNEIDERFKAEEALRENEAQLQDLFDNALDFIQILDAEGRFVSVNKSWREAMGYSHEEIGRMTLQTAIAPESVPHCRACFERALAGEDVGQVEFTMLSRDGRRIVVEGYVNPRIEDGKVVAVRSILRDITERKKLEQNLRNAEKLESIGVLAGGIAHEFNNLMSAVLGRISLAADLLPPSSPARQQLADAEAATLRGRDLTLQLITFAKGGAPIRCETDLPGLVRDSAEFSTRGTPVRCRYSFPERLAKVDADSGQLGQVVQNLVANAVQAMPEGGEIRIDAENVVLPAGHPLASRSPHFVRIDVEDRGTGIHPDYLQRIFDPFFTTRKDANGLGLAVCYSVVRQHGGEITVDSRPGIGATFHVLLPASGASLPEAAPQGAGSSSKPAEDAKPVRRRILVMDDEEIVRNVATEVLGVMGYDSDGVGNGEEAIEAYSKAKAEGVPYSAVIMDLSVPVGMGGKEAVSRVLEIDPAARVIVSSGYSSDPVMADFRSFGFCGVIAKPYRIGELRQLLSRILPAGPSRGEEGA